MILLFRTVVVMSTATCTNIGFVVGTIFIVLYKHNIVEIVKLVAAVFHCWMAAKDSSKPEGSF